MFSVPAPLGFDLFPVVLVDAGKSLGTALLVIGVALVCGIAIRLLEDARLPRIEVRPARTSRPQLKRVA
jgi:hypothetical protein